MLSKTEIHIDSQKILPILAKALEKPILELPNWKVEPLGGGAEQNHRLFRLSGEAVLSGEGQILSPWSLVVKIVQPLPNAEKDPQGLYYWEREASVYHSGILEELPYGITAPRCYEARQEGNGYWLWLEEVQDDLGKPWPIQHHYTVAQNLGSFNGAYLTGKPLPDKPWLSRHWLRKYVESAAPIIQNLPEIRKLDLFKRSFQGLKAETILEAWEKRGYFLDAIERLPKTFCHQDATEGNLFWRGRAGEKGSLTALDWAFSGTAAVGEELAPLIFVASFTWDAKELFEICLEGYLAGLSECDWSGDQGQVRFSVLTTIFYRYLFGGVLGEVWGTLQDESKHEALAAAWGLPNAGILCDLINSFNPMFQKFYIEARQLLAKFS